MEIRFKFKVGDKVYFYHEGSLQCHPISRIVIGPEPDTIIYKIWDGKRDISRFEDKLYTTPEEADQYLEDYHKAIDESLGLDRLGEDGLYVW